MTHAYASRKPPSLEFYLKKRVKKCGGDVHMIVRPVRYLVVLPQTQAVFVELISIRPLVKDIKTRERLWALGQPVVWLTGAEDVDQFIDLWVKGVEDNMEHHPLDS